MLTVKLRLTAVSDPQHGVFTAGSKPSILGVDRRSFRQLDGTIGDDWIINDGGETTIVVHSVTLHDGATGSTGLKAANGAWDVMVIDEGVTVDTSTTPWTISASSRAKRPDALLPPNRREAHDSATHHDRPAGPARLDADPLGER